MSALRLKNSFTFPLSQRNHLFSCMNIQSIYQQFNVPSIQSSEPLISGLINNSYRINSAEGNSYFLQRINTSIFKNPAALQNNYALIQQHLLHNKELKLPKMIKTVSGDLFYSHNGEVWRCFQFVKNTYSPTVVETPEKAYEVARCFGSFTAALHNVDSQKLEVVLPQFHDLNFRFSQFTNALHDASKERKEDVKDLIDRVENHASLLTLFQNISLNKKAFPLHIMHHDCKISNILFDKETNAIRCPIDLDTTQPGLFFSDIGDMIRTIVCSLNEDAPNVNDLILRPGFFEAVSEGYMSAMSDFLTEAEKSAIHYAGSLMAYMQAIRFLTDHLNGNIYYKTYYPQQNRDRTANQLKLLDLLTDFIK